MARQANAVEVNKFNAGLNTDASPLTSPENSSLEEDNFVLNIDGSRNRRLGLDLEPNYQIVNTAIANADSVKIAVSTFRWDNAGGDAEKSIEVVQIGNEVKFFDLDFSSISSGLFYTLTMDSAVATTKASFTVVDGILVIVTGEKFIRYLTYSPPSTITLKTSRLYIRDMFGVDDFFDGIDITRNTEVQNRPSGIGDAHLYNLRNQSWGLPRISSSGEELADPVAWFRAVANQVGTIKYPSNADTVNEALYPDPEDTDNRTIDRFFAMDLFKNPVGSSRAAQGFFIIDALDRGTSRLQQEANNRARYAELANLPVTTLPLDSTPNGPTTVSEFAGRVFYAGFPGNVISGGDHSPRMSSYVLFSKIVDGPNDISLCYQEGDPTSKDNPDIIDTDGGFIRINEAFGIKKLINLGSSLIVVATNGVWRILGGDNGFTATQYIVEKITDRGCTSADSIATIDNSFMFWSDDAIYHVTPDQYGSWVCNNISFGRIQKLYDNINIEDKRYAKGEYDSYERKVRWLYYNRTTDSTATKELVLDLQLQGFYTNTIGKLGGLNWPRAVSMYISRPYTISTDNVGVIVGVDDVLVGVDQVVLSTEELSGISQREIGYVVITEITPTVKFSFATYRNTEFRDWFSIDSVGVDAAAYVVTSYISGSDFQRDKQIPYMTVHLRRTEIGFEDVDEVTPIGQSSCIVQARWDWSNSDRSGKWGRPFQAYRYRRLYIPVDVNDTYDNGFSTVVTRNKLRGNGKVLSLKFSTEPYRNLHLYGWSMVLSVAENV